MVFTFILFLTLFAVIGLSTAFMSRGTKEDYYLASRSIPPSLVGLSAVATNNSGYMFIGMIGYTYVTGLSSIWLMVGWILGDFLASLFIHRSLRQATERSNEVSFAGVLSGWNGTQPILQKVIALITLLFLLAYASAQLVAGSKALMVLFGWPSWTGAVIGAVLVVMYCLAGGIRASIWTDVAQSIVMIFAMALLLITAVTTLGGVSESLTALNSVDGFMTLFPQSDTLVFPGIIGGLLFAVAWAFAGFSVIGQPHIMVRFMTLDDESKMLRARAWYYLWFILFYAFAVGVGLLSRVYIADTGSFDAELALPTMAQQLLHPALAGVILAGVFAATMSTADSVILSCSSAVTHDLIPHKVENTTLIKIGTAFITAIALVWALVSKESVFSMVVMAWSGLGSSFAPLLFVLALGAKPTQRNAIAGIVTGLLVALLWRSLGWHTALYEGMPAIVAGLLVYSPALWRRFAPRSRKMK